MAKAAHRHANRGVDDVSLRILAILGFLSALAPAFAQADLATAPMQLSLEVTTDSLSQECRRLHAAMGSKNFQGVGFVDASSPATVAFAIDRISAWQIDP